MHNIGFLQSCQHSQLSHFQGKTRLFSPINLSLFDFLGGVFLPFVAPAQSLDFEIVFLFFLAIIQLSELLIFICSLFKCSPNICEARTMFLELIILDLEIRKQ
jgi:hypothetical protein